MNSGTYIHTHRLYIFYVLCDCINIMPEVKLNKRASNKKYIYVLLSQLIGYVVLVNGKIIIPTITIVHANYVGI